MRFLLLRRLALVLVFALVVAAQVGAGISARQATYTPPLAEKLILTFGYAAYLDFERYSFEFPGQEELLDSAWRNLARRAGLSPSARPEGLSAAEEVVRSDLTYAIENNRTMASQFDLLDAYILGMIAAAHDSHTSYERVSGPLTFLNRPWYGFRTVADGNWTIVSQVTEGWPAGESGVRVGDVIVSMNGVRHPVPGAVPGLDEGMKLVLSRDGGRTTVQLEPTFEPPPQIEAEMLEGDIGLLRIYSFQVGTFLFDRDLATAMSALRESRALIVDLRNNGGGSSGNAAETLAAVGYDGIVATFTERDGESDSVSTSTPAARLPVLPMTVLVNESTFSAAEVIAFILQKSRGAKVIGTKTVGSVRASASFNFGNGYLSLGVARLDVGASQTDLEGVGVTPDIGVKQDFKRLRKGEDNVIERAIEVLKAAH